MPRKKTAKKATRITGKKKVASKNTEPKKRGRRRKTRVPVTQEEIDFLKAESEKLPIPEYIGANPVATAAVKRLSIDWKAVIKRREVVAGLMARLIPKCQISEILSKEYGVAVRTIEKDVWYIEREWAKDSKSKRRSNRYKIVHRVESIEKQAIAAGEWISALRANEQLAKLYGLHEHYRDIEKGKELPEDFDVMSSDGQGIVIRGIISKMYTEVENWREGDHNQFRQYMDLLRRINKQEIVVERPLLGQMDAIFDVVARSTGITAEELRDSMQKELSKRITEDNVDKYNKGDVAK